MILLDTCAIIWEALDRTRLSSEASRAIERHENGLMICSISLWEIALLMQKNRLNVDCGISDFLDLVLQTRVYRVQEITPRIAELSVGLGSKVGSDPADRLIAATSVLLGAPVVSADRRFRGAGIVEVIW